MHDAKGDGVPEGLTKDYIIYEKSLITLIEVLALLFI